MIVNPWNSRVLSVLCVLICCFAPALVSQTASEPPIEWGNIPRSDLEMKSYAPDTSAAAIVLCDYGETSLNDELNLEFVHHRRIKIFKPSGYDWATESISFYAGDKVQWVRNIEGATYSIGPDGNVIVTELDKSSVFSEDYDQTFKRYRFTLPALQPGCVIEYRYRLFADNLVYIHNWTFQSSIPTVWSEYRVRVPRVISYAVLTEGYELFTINDVTDAVQHFSGSAASYLHEGLVACNQFRWVLKDGPAVLEEPYLSTIEDCYTKVTLQLRAFAVFGGVQAVITSWDQVIKNLLDDSDFGGRLDATSAVRDHTDEITKGLTSPADRMRAIYDEVRSTITCSNVHQWYASKDPDDLLESRRGNNADIAFLLIAMLRHAGIEADPVILSTRGHGKVQTLYPMLTQFNDVLVYARIGGSDLFLDATDVHRAMDLIPTEALNVQGLVVKPGPLQWVTVTSPRQAIRRSSVRMAVAEDGALRASVGTVAEDYDALLQRQSLRGSKDLEYTKRLYDCDRSALQPDSVKIGGKDSVYSPLRIDAVLTSESYAQVAGDKMYVNPTVIDRMVENPFKAAVRKYPVDMNYCRLSSLAVTMEIPAGWEVKEVPQNRDSRVGTADAFYRRSVAVAGGTLTLSREIVIQRVEFQPRQYERLKSFYGQMVNWDSEQIVLQKIAAKPPVRASGGKKR